MRYIVGGHFSSTWLTRLVEHTYYDLTSRAKRNRTNTLSSCIPGIHYAVLDVTVKRVYVSC